MPQRRLTIITATRLATSNQQSIIKQERERKSSSKLPTRPPLNLTKLPDNEEHEQYRPVHRPSCSAVRRCSHRRRQQFGVDETAFSAERSLRESCTYPVDCARCQCPSGGRVQV